MAYAQLSLQSPREIHSCEYVHARIESRKTDVRHWEKIYRADTRRVSLGSVRDLVARMRACPRDHASRARELTNGGSGTTHETQFVPPLVSVITDRYFTFQFALRNARKRINRWDWHAVQRDNSICCLAACRLLLAANTSRLVLSMNDRLFLFWKRTRKCTFASVGSYIDFGNVEVFKSLQFPSETLK